jgi:HD-GYP domain
VSLAFFEGEFRPSSSVSIPVTDLALQRGVGVFDSLRTLGGKPLGLSLHLDRLEHSLEEASIAHPASRAEIEAVIREGIARMDGESTVRIYVTGGDRHEDGAFPAPRWFALFEPTHRPDRSVTAQGVVLWPLPHERPLPLLKSINYMASFVEKGLHPETYEILYCPGGEITEATASNAFMVIDGKIVTAPLERVLSGVTRTFCPRGCTGSRIHGGGTLPPSRRVAKGRRIFHHRERQGNPPRREGRGDPHRGRKTRPGDLPLDPAPGRIPRTLGGLNSMRVLVASSSVPNAETLAGLLQKEGILAVSWEVGTEAPRPEEDCWDALVLDLRSPWPVRVRFLPAGPRIAVLDPLDQAAREIARQRGAKEVLPDRETGKLAETIRRMAGEARQPLPELFMRAELPLALVHPLYGIEEGNSSFCRWMEAEEADLRGLDLPSLLGPDEAHSLGCVFLDLLSGERNEDCRKVAFRRQGGTDRIGEASFSAVFRNDLEQARILMIVKDGERNRQAEDRLDEESRKLAVLQSINLALNTSLDPQTTIKALVNLLRSHTDVDAAAVFLLDEGTMKLRFAEGEGFFGQTIRSMSLASGQGLAGYAALTRGPVFLPDLDSPGDLSPDPFLLREERFCAACAVPLVAMNRVLGVVEIFRRQHPENPESWKEMIASVARQASVTLHRALLVEELERANLELNLAYDSTIEGWSRALDLKCREPEGHTGKVTEMTILLARRMGVKEKELQSIRRGAVLHDIGKMGIPDSILTKPGPLTDEEWKIMRLHPVYALKMLQPIAFLRDALAIPHSHHEHWDGPGVSPRPEGGTDPPCRTDICRRGRLEQPHGRPALPKGLEARPRAAVYPRKCGAPL